MLTDEPAAKRPRRFYAVAEAANVLGLSEPDELGAVLAGVLELAPAALELLRCRQLSRSSPVSPAH